MPSVYDGILYNVAVVVAEELDPTTLLPFPDGIYHRLNCTQTVSITPQYSNGEETVVRQDMQILNTFRTPDLLYGYRIVLKNSYLNQEFMELVEGGEHIFNEYRMGRLEDGMVTKPFRLTLWVENYQGASVRNYVMLRYNYCYGKMDSVTLGQQFMMPTFTIEAREPTMLPDRPIRDVFYTDYLPDDPNAELPKRYGFRIDKNNPDPEGRIVYTHDAIGHVPARMDFTGGESKNLINSVWHRQTNSVSGGLTWAPVANTQSSVYTVTGTVTGNSTLYFGLTQSSTSNSLINWLKSTGEWKVGNSFTISCDYSRSTLTYNGNSVRLDEYINGDNTTLEIMRCRFLFQAPNVSGTTVLASDVMTLTEDNIDEISFLVPSAVIVGEVGATVTGTLYYQLEKGAYGSVSMLGKYEKINDTISSTNTISFGSLTERGVGGTPWQSPNDKGRFLPASWETTFFMKNNNPVLMLNGEIDYELSKENQLFRKQKLDKTTYNLVELGFETGVISTTTGLPTNSSNQLYMRTANFIPVPGGASFVLTIDFQPGLPVANASYVFWYDENEEFINYKQTARGDFIFPIVSPINAKYVKFYFHVGLTSDDPPPASLVLSSTLTFEGNQISDVVNKRYQGDAMSEIPLCWLYQYEDENYEYCIVSNVQFDENYTAWAHQGTNGQINDVTYIGMFEPSQALYTTTGTLKSQAFREQRRSMNFANMQAYSRRAGNVVGYDMFSNAKFNLLRMLTLLIGKSDNSQAIFGEGHPLQNLGAPKTGTLVTNGQFNGTNYDSSNLYKCVKLFYIENLWNSTYKAVVGVRLNFGVYQKIQGNFIHDDTFFDIGQPVEYGGAVLTYYSGTKMVDGVRYPQNVSGGSSNTYVTDVIFNQDNNNSYPIIVIGMGNRAISTIAQAGINGWYNHVGGSSTSVTTFIIFDK